jgi:hypothetical protein
MTKPTKRKRPESEGAGARVAVSEARLRSAALAYAKVANLAPTDRRWRRAVPALAVVSDHPLLDGCSLGLDGFAVDSNTPAWRSVSLHRRYGLDGWIYWRPNGSGDGQACHFPCSDCPRRLERDHCVPGDPMTRLLRIGTCRVCGTGNLGIRLAASGGCVVAMCDECDAVWLDKEFLDGPHFPAQPNLPCPGEGSSLRIAPARWATRADATGRGWADAVIEETDTIG